MAYLDTVKTAQEVVAEAGDAEVLAFEQDLKDDATAAGVTHSEYIGYADAMTNYESRDDVEPLVERRAREAGDAFADTDFRRAGTGSIAVLTSPGDGNVG
jgi:uncharacterized membrane protein